MKLKPLKNSKKPNYPTIELYINNPVLLSKNVPENWLKNSCVATSLATFILLGSPKIKVQASCINTAITDKIDFVQNDTIKEVIKDSVKIAPIFAHGEGSGSTGCVVISPPVFISEIEAKELIFKRLKKEGFNLKIENNDTIQFKSKQIIETNFSFEEIKEYPEINIVIKMDAYDSLLNFAIIYVSKDDYKNFVDIENWSRWTVKSYQTKKAAELIRNGFIENGKTNAVVFYEPLRTGNEYTHRELMEFELKGENYESTERNLSKQLLLDQVEDFIKWIKQENIIIK